MSAHEHIFRRYVAEDEETGGKESLKKILKELEAHADIPGVGVIARDLDDLLNAPVADE